MNNSSEKIVTAKQAQKSAKVFYYGNIASVIIPFPLFIFWFGASMFVYAMYRHHPNDRVGFYTQKAATYYYTLAGFLSVVLLFATKDFFYSYGWMLWLLCVFIMIPLSVLQIKKINREVWVDTKINNLE